MTCTEDRFLSDVSRHELTIIRDDGLYRHIRLKRPGSSVYWFDVVTWPGFLCICGDAGDYLFSRSPDMFKFFRRETCDRGRLPISPDYWSGKLVAPRGGRSEGGDAVWVWDHGQFEDCVKADMEAYIEHNMAGFEDDAQRLRDEVKDEILNCDDNEFDCLHAVNSFSFQYDEDRKRYCDILKRMVPHPREFRFEDFYEHNCHTYAFRFLWICYAVVYAIQQYDHRKARPWYRIAIDECRKRSPVWKRRALKEQTV